MLNILRYARAGQRVCCTAKGMYTKVPKRTGKWFNSEHRWYYREEMPYVPGFIWHYSTLYMAVVTFYIGYCFYNYGGHLSGHPKIKPSRWTDEELGIPPDEEDIYPPGYIPLKDRV